MSMKCPECGTWTSVKETRTRKEQNLVLRRYECANLHRFTTEETVRCKPVLSKDPSAGLVNNQGLFAG
jgi:transcriptional regulator NrdR family protein